MSDELLSKENFTADQLTTRQIIEIFSYNSNERDAFPYLRRYMKTISQKLDEIENDEEKLKRFALAGLFLTYRAFNHSGSPMETEKLDNLDSGIHKLRLAAFRDYFKTEIKDTNHYLKMIDFSVLDFLLLFFRLKSLPRKLYKFVVK